MIRIFMLVVILFFTSSTILISGEKDCSQYNKVTNWKGWKKCMKGEQKSVEKNKSGNFFSNIWPISYFTFEQLKLFFSLILIAISCIIMGAGIPTTATYIILVAVAAPALAQLNIEPLVAHFFVFYYGVLADITPPVALAAYAASGIAKSNPFKTCNS